MVAIATVHTSGVNWQSIAVLVVSIVGCFIAVATYIDKRAGSRQEMIKDEIQSSVSHLSDVLSERLETKENVSALKVQLAQLQGQVTRLDQEVHNQ
jgi:peptidoglycan hydrolase CwlO-like protein